MRQRFVVPFLAVVAAALGLTPAQADQVEIKGVHLCCGRCVTDAQNVLKKIDGVSDIKVDQKTKSVAFTAKDGKTAAEGTNALLKAGYFGGILQDGMAVVLTVEAVEGKADELTIKDAHICCGACKKAITALYPDAKVSFPATNEFKLEGKDLDRGKVLATLQKAGFNGTVGK
jgi:periplasmic mercuric ion binding protein